MEHLLGELARGVPLSMSRVGSEYLHAHPFDHLTIAGVRFREEPGEEEDEEEEDKKDEGDGEEGDEDDDQDSGYSVGACQTVLTTLRQVEDNLAALRILEQEAGVQAVAVQAAEQSPVLSNTRHEGGVTSYLEVITARMLHSRMR